MRSKGISGHDDKEGFYEPLYKAQSSGDIEAIIRFEDNTVLLPHSPWFPSFFLSGSKSREKLEHSVHSHGVTVWVQATLLSSTKGFELDTK